MPTKIRKFGTLFLDDQPYIVDPNGLMDMPNGSISIQDTVRGMPLEWLEYDDQLVSKSPLLRFASHPALLKNHLAGGQEVCLEDVRYEIRLPIAGTANVPSLDDRWFRLGQPVFSLGDRASALCLGIRKKYSVPSEDDRVFASHFAYMDSPQWMHLSELSGAQMFDICWRPILEPVFLDPEKLKPGTAVRVRYGVLSEVFGNLAEVSKYDIVLDNMFGYSTAKDGEGAKLIGEKKLVIERASIHQLRRNRS